MKHIFTVLVVWMFVTMLQAQENYIKIRIDLQGESLEQIAELGIDVTEGYYLRAKFLETDMSEAQLIKLDVAGVNYTIINSDVASYYANRAAADKVEVINRSRDGEWVVPENWEFGSMGGFYTLSEVMAELDDMRTMYPELISAREPLSETNLTHDGRMQYWVRISDNPDVNEDEPEVLYTGVHHAREPMSVQQTIFYMWYLLENYDTDEDIQQLVNNTEMYFVPVINADGYEYNHQTNPNGGGMWRKNRRDNGGGIYGVDPNRNYGFMWGLDNTGSSPDPDDQTYRGPEAFSEPEIQNIRDFCEMHEFGIALNYHSYSNLLLYTWGWTEDPCDDDALLHDYSVLMTKENNYVYGPGSTAIYPTNGGSDDWMYGEQSTKDAILSFTPEVGSQDDGFWPTTSRIIPLCKDQMWQNITAARLVGKYAEVTDMAPGVIGDVAGYLPFSIKRLGLADAEQFVVSIEPLDDYITSVGNPVTFENLELMESAVDSIEYSLLGTIETGTVFSYLLSVDNGDYIVKDTIEKVFGELVVVFEDDGNDMENWVSSEWNITANEYHSSPASITDSPNGNYSNDENNYVLLDSIIDLTDVTLAYVDFWAKWEIESGYDYVQFMAKDVNSGTWEALEGKFTKPGTSYQQEGDPVYDGMVAEWKHEDISLSDYIGKEVEFKFRLVSDSYVVEDGFYFDDFTISVVSNITSVDDELATETGLLLENAYPNPVDNLINIGYSLNNNSQHAVIEVVNMLGNVVATKQLISSKGVVVIDVSNISSGVYFYRLVSKTGASTVKRFVKR